MGRVKLIARASTVRCAVCHDDARDLAACPGCRTRVHADCRDGRCPTLGCAGVTRARAAWRLAALLPVGLPGWVRVIEALCALFVIGVVGLALLVAFVPWHHPRSPSRTARAIAMRIHTAAELFRLDHRRWPESLDQLREGRYLDLDPDRDVDPWGSAYRLRRGDDELRVVSYGPDGRPGGDDDIIVGAGR